MTGFDVCGPLPTGVTVLEASAGTGKTYTIAALAARYVAEGTPLDQILLVTFTRMATGELRERVRERLVSAERGLGRALAGAGPDERDAVVRMLAEGPREDVELEHQLVFGGQLAFADLLEKSPRADEAGAGWDDEEPTRFGRLARRLWDGVLAHEAVTDE